MRELILKRIAAIKESNRGFEKSYRKWDNMEVTGVHISQVDFDKVSDADLVNVFERIIRTSQINTNQDSTNEKRPGWRDTNFSATRTTCQEDKL